ncbi:MAG: phosphopyruvate hydratase [Candidatus Woesearchaeota archaeon]|jgi:enolase|nr:phosphopyruvate hydratase [Candidatus Woesearchaeota archaeon]
MKIVSIESLQILDSRGNPTIEVKIVLDDGSAGSFRVPSGASTGIHEACELRDNNKNLFHGKSVLKAVDNVYKIKEELLNIDFNQKSFDEFLIEYDGTTNKELLGANAILGLSIAFSKASAKYYNLPLYEYLNRLANGLSFDLKTIAKPEPINLFANVINGGLHSGNSLNIQEFMIIPVFGSVYDRIRAISEIYQTLKVLIEEKYGKSNTAVGDEGGFAPDISKPTEALDLLVDAIEKSNYKGEVFLAMDAAASDFYDSTTKLYEVEKGVKLDFKKLTKYYSDLVDKYPIISIEDAMAEDDFEGFAYYLQNVSKLKIKNPISGKKESFSVGDDLLVTNPERIKLAIDKKLCSSLLLKINQIGTLTESIEAHKMAKAVGWHTIVSHRSGETVDDFIADLSVALESSIKIGAPARGERVAKYNRLLNIYK